MDNLNLSNNVSEFFTPETLSKYDGLNGQPAYVAVDGVVYDLSPVFYKGMHQGYTPGQDLTEAFHNQHPESFLKKYKVVGIYKP